MCCTVVNELKFQYYRSLILQIKRGNFRGSIINAKPFLLLAVINLIDNGYLKHNKIQYDDILIERYMQISRQSNSKSEVTPMYKPFYHLSSDGFWHLKCENGKIKCNVSHKYIRDNIHYAFIDEPLWDLLQAKNVRILFTELIKDFFIV